MNENEAERICSQIKTCDDCNGTGDSNWKRRRDGAALKTCSTCKGTGCEPESLRRAEAALSAKEGTQ